MPAEWRETVTRWAQMNRGKKCTVENAVAPSANDEYLLYQSLVGARPRNLRDPNALDSFRTRVTAFMQKAVKEGKVNTSWTEPNAAYEKALEQFIGHLLESSDQNSFVGELERFGRRVAFFGRFNSMSQTLLKITSPGVPDFYQGDELWDLNLVDPDNRRPVDYAARKRILAELKSDFEKVADAAGDFFRGLLEDKTPGAMKQFLVWRALNFRAAHRELFDAGEYLPLVTAGQHAENVCAFAKAWKQQTVVVIAPRLVFGLMEGAEVAPIGTEIWKETLLRLPQAPPGDLFRNVLTREMVPVIEKDGTAALELRQALKSFPVALLEKI